MVRGQPLFDHSDNRVCRVLEGDIHSEAIPLPRYLQQSGEDSFLRRHREKLVRIDGERHENGREHAGLSGKEFTGCHLSSRKTTSRTYTSIVPMSSLRRSTTGISSVDVCGPSV